MKAGSGSMASNSSYCACVRLKGGGVTWAGRPGLESLQSQVKSLSRMGQWDGDSSEGLYSQREGNAR